MAALTEQRARELDLALVSVTTADGEHFTRKIMTPVPGDPGAVMLLPEEFTEGHPDPDAVLELADVARCTVHNPA